MIKNLILLFCLTVLTFANSLKNPFMLDDYAFFGSGQKTPLWSFFIPNPNEQLKIDSPNTDRTYYRPLAHVIPQVSYRMFGHNVVGHHTLNMFLMWLAACAIYVFLRRFMPYEQKDPNGWFAFAVAALFIAHPISGVLINYITASVYSAQVALMLGSLICLYPRRDSHGANAVWGIKTWEYWGAVVFFLLSLLCHETAVLLPVYAVIVLKSKYSWREVGLRITPFLAVLVAYFAFRAYASPFKRSILHSLSILDLTLLEKVATIFKLLSWYLEKLFVPHSIFLMWSTPFVIEQTWLWLVAGTGVSSIIIALVFWVRTSSREEGTRLGVFLFWFMLGLTPIAAGAFVTPYLGGLIEPHWFVFATVGFFALIVMMIQKFPILSWRKTVMAALIGVLVMLSWVNNRLWSDEVSYYQAWAKEAPGFKAVHYFLGMNYVRRGEFDKAYAELEQTILGRYKDWMVYLELGQIDLKRRDFERAKKNIMSAYSLEKRHSGVLNAVGALHYKLGDRETAKGFFERAIVSNPGNLEPYMNLALYHKKNHDLEKAAQLYLQILKINPQFEPARQSLRSLNKTEFQPPGLE